MARTGRLTVRGHIFTMHYWRDGRWLVGQLREVPGVFSQGRTLSELRANIRDAYRLTPSERLVRPAARAARRRRLRRAALAVEVPRSRGTVRSRTHCAG